MLIWNGICSSSSGSPEECWVCSAAWAVTQGDTSLWGIVPASNGHCANLLVETSRKPDKRLQNYFFCRHISLMYELYVCMYVCTYVYAEGSTACNIYSLAPRAGLKHIKINTVWVTSWHKGTDSFAGAMLVYSRDLAEALQKLESSSLEINTCKVDFEFPGSVR